MFYHLILNTACNLHCAYCDRDNFSAPDEKLYDYNLSSRMEYPIEKLKTFITKNDYITFYGGEPLLSYPQIEFIMDNIQCKGFMIQTNGTLLNKIKPQYAQRLHTVLVSIDGDVESTDKNRGVGVQKLVMENIRIFKKNGFQGELIARMTITQGSSLKKQVFWLLENGFINIHWQLDVLFYDEQDSSWLQNYNQEVSELFSYWTEEAQKGNIFRLYPFLILMDSILKNEPTKLRCGAGYSNYTINTNGDLAPCPIMGGIKKYYCGSIDSFEIKEIDVGEPCISCDVKNLCGGRCLYTNLLSQEKTKEYDLVCNTVRHLIKTIQEKELIFRKLFEKGILKREQFFYLKYNGVEVIP